MSEGLPKLWREHMRCSDFESAWRISDQLMRKRNGCRPVYICHEASWRGESLKQKRVLVRCCYGLGDTLQFVRYLPLLRRIACRVILHVQSAVARVLEHVDGIDALVTRYNTISRESYDVAVGLTAAHFPKTY